MKNKKNRHYAFFIRIAVLAPVFVVLAALPFCVRYVNREQEIKAREEGLVVAGTVGEGTEVAEVPETVSDGTSSDTSGGAAGDSETENSLTEEHAEAGIRSETGSAAESEQETEIDFVDGQRVVRAVSSGPEPESAGSAKETEEESDGALNNSAAEPESAGFKGGLVNGLIAENEKNRDEAGQADRNAEAVPVSHKVAIDPGHQGSWVDMSAPEPVAPGASQTKPKATTGTQSPYTGYAEYELNLAISLALREELTVRGYEVVMTREDNDTAISNKERAQLAAAQGAEVLVRIHANGSDDPSVKGALAMVPSSENPYVARLAADSMRLGQCVLERYCERASFQNLGIQLHDDMSGINWSEIPVMILEMGFMTNQEDDSRMADPEVQKQMVQGIADGLDQYFGIENRAEATGMSSGTADPAAGGTSQEITADPAATLELSSADQARVTQALEKVRTDYVQGAQASGEQWSVALLDLNTGADAQLDGTQRMASASVIKVFLMAAVYDRIIYPETEERRIPSSQAYEGELRQLLASMITVSDNDAANTLLDRLGQGDGRTGMEVVNAYCMEHGYTGTSFGRKFLESNPTGDNYTTAQDCMNLLCAIYQGTCVNRTASGEMYELLKQQTRTWKIPAGLSGTGAQTANKTGELYGEYGNVVENDIAIVTTGKTNYVLAVLSGHLRSNEGGQSMIQNISRTIYESLQ